MQLLVQLNQKLAVISFSRLNNLFIKKLSNCSVLFCFIYYGNHHLNTLVGKESSLKAWFSSYSYDSNHTDSKLASICSILVYQSSRFLHDRHAAEILLHWLAVFAGNDKLFCDTVRQQHKVICVFVQFIISMMKWWNKISLPFMISNN